MVKDEDVDPRAEYIPDALHGAAEEHMKKIDMAVDECIAMFLFGFLVVAAGMQWLINYKDADIRSSVYKMISTTITIFCAVLITQAIFEFLTTQVLLSPQPRGFGLKEVGPRLEVAVDSAIFLIFLALINVCCWLLSESKIWLYVARNLLAHLCAFAGIRACEVLLDEAREKLQLVLATALGLILVQVCLMAVAAQAREYLEQGKCPHGHNDESEDEEEPIWMEAAREAEDEATVLISGFIASQVVCYLVMEEMPPAEAGPGEGEWFSSEYLGSENSPFKGLTEWTVAFLVLVFIATYLRAILGLEGFAGRLAGNFHSFLTMTFAFCLLRLATWLAIKTWHAHSDLAYVLCSLVLSASCIIAMICIDWVADRVLNRNQRHPIKDRDSTPTSSPQQPHQPSSSADTPSARVGEGEGDSYDWGNSDRENELSSGDESDSLTRVGTPEQLGGLTKRRKRWERAFQRNLRSNRNFEQAFRTVIAGLGIVIGLSWEIAFNVAEETIAMQMSAFKAHPVLMRNFVAMILVAIIVPAWMKFIAPKSLMHRDWHQKRIDQELEAEAQNPDLVPRPELCVKKLLCALCCCCCGGCPSKGDSDDEGPSARGP